MGQRFSKSLRTAQDSEWQKGDRRSCYSACASRHVAVNGNTKRETSDALSMGSSIYTFPRNGVIPPVLRKVLHRSTGAVTQAVVP